MISRSRKWTCCPLCGQYGAFTFKQYKNKDDSYYCQYCKGNFK